MQLNIARFINNVIILHEQFLVDRRYPGIHSVPFESLNEINLSNKTNDWESHQSITCRQEEQQQAKWKHVWECAMATYTCSLLRCTYEHRSSQIHSTGYLCVNVCISVFRWNWCLLCSGTELYVCSFQTRKQKLNTNSFIIHKKSKSITGHLPQRWWEHRPQPGWFQQWPPVSPHWRRATDGSWTTGQHHYSAGRPES